MTTPPGTDGRRSAALAWTLLALLAADAEPILVKLGYQSHATPLQFLVLKTIVAAILIHPLARTWKWPGWREVARIASVSVLLLVTNMCWCGVRCADRVRGDRPAAAVG